MTRAPAPRIGVFGGAFDPPHAAHVALAQAALEQLDLAQLRIFPTGQAWHKERAISPAEHRLAMARLAFGELPRTVVDAREVERPGPTYTVDTLRELKAEFPQAALVLLMGADQAAALERWHEWEAILDLAIISIADRPASVSAMPWSTRSAARIERLRLPPLAVSATDIRSRVAAGRAIARLVPDAVARYIDQHHLYRTA